MRRWGFFILMEQTLPKVGRYPFMAEPFHCDFSSRLFMGHLGNYMLNAADFHAADRGYSMHSLMSQQKTWVLSRLAIEVAEIPMSYDRFFVETWVERVMRFFTSRNFRIVGSDDKVYGYGKSIWAMIDTMSRQPVDILSVNGGLLQQYIEQEKPCPIDNPSRVALTGDGKLMKEIATCYSDVDVNGHINSVKYIEHILDLFDLDFYRKHQLRRIDIAYVAETHQGDKLRFYQYSADNGSYSIKVAKVSNGEETETCRCQLKFAHSGQ